MQTPPVLVAWQGSVDVLETVHTKSALSPLSIPVGQGGINIPPKTVLKLPVSLAPADPPPPPINTVLARLDALTVDVIFVISSNNELSIELTWLEIDAESVGWVPPGPRVMPVFPASAFVVAVAFTVEVVTPDCEGDTTMVVVAVPDVTATTANVLVAVPLWDSTTARVDVVAPEGTTTTAAVVVLTPSVTVSVAGGT